MRGGTLFLCAALALGASTGALRGQAVPGGSDVIAQARRLAIETARTLDSVGPAAFRVAPRTAPLIDALRRAGPTGRATLKTAMTARDSSYVTRSAAAYAMYFVDSTQVDSVVAVLVSQINRMGFADWRLAESLILAIGEPAVPELARHLNDAMVVSLLGRMGRRASSAVPTLRQSMGDNNLEVATTLAAIGTAEAVAAAKPVLIGALSDGDAEDTKMALIALGSLGSGARDVAPQIRNVLTHPSPEVRAYAGLALLELGDTASALPILGRLVASDGLENRYAVIAKLGALGPAAAGVIPDLVKALGDTTDRRVGERADVGVALQRIAPGDARVRDALRAAARDAPLRQALRTRAVLVP